MVRAGAEAAASSVLSYHSHKFHAHKAPLHDVYLADAIVAHHLQRDESCSGCVSQAAAASMNLCTPLAAASPALLRTIVNQLQKRLSNDSSVSEMRLRKHPSAGIGARYMRIQKCRNHLHAAGELGALPGSALIVCPPAELSRSLAPSNKCTHQQALTPAQMLCMFHVRCWSHLV